MQIAPNSVILFVRLLTHLVVSKHVFYGGIDSNFVTNWITAYTTREQSLDERQGQD